MLDGYPRPFRELIYTNFANSLFIAA